MLFNENKKKRTTFKKYKRFCRGCGEIKEVKGKNSTKCFDCVKLAKQKIAESNRNRKFNNTVRDLWKVTKIEA